MMSVSVPLLKLNLKRLWVLCALWAWSAPGACVDNSTVPEGCGEGVQPLYFGLCDLGAAWGIVVEAFAAAGVVSALMLLLVLLGSLPFASAGPRRTTVGLQAGFLLGTLGLFALAFACVVGRDFATCSSRRFLFGVLFAGCFSCLLAHGGALSVLATRGPQSDPTGPHGWALCLGALALWLVEVIINTEWLIITVVRYPPAASGGAAVPCAIANPDFVAALVYVMALLLAAVLAALPALAGGQKPCQRDAAFILITSLLSAGIWAAWIAMYVYGNALHGSPDWDDPTLAIALISNGWVFLVLYTIPQICVLNEEGAAPPGYSEDLYPSRGVGYETILKEQSSHSMFMENKAFSMEEPNAAQKPVSPYSGYNGQLRSSVYQPTELALITKGLGSQVDLSYDTVLPRASAQTQSGSSTPRAEEPSPSNGNGLHRKPQW
ncbi:hypothetical protein AGOR_G00195740 [Albula goreensis]|uniref:G-protein coupled receptors family 3 profile domain-containing protein n=1 Tax=Albula goreensis TaxID=1534307 RepID=A0A8T3CPV4_9TELE|nr:hypothetical protein AGOR_G00195740 [Albula goreensis]